MVHIKFGEGLPGIRGALAFSPETTKPNCANWWKSYCAARKR